MLFVDKPIDFSKLQTEFDYCGVHYQAIGKPYMKEVRATGIVAGYSGPLHIGRSAKSGEYAYRVKEVADNAFKGAPITSLAIHDMIKVGRYSFANCPQLTSAEIPAKTFVIPAGLFAGSPLDTVICTQSIKEVGDSAFLNTRLHSFPLNTSSLTRVGVQAFKGSLLASVTLPSVKVQIGAEAFATPTITHVTNQIFAPAAIPDDAFSAETYANATLNVPLGATAEYRKATGWKNFVNIVEDGSIEPTLGGIAVVDGLWYRLESMGARVMGCTTEADGTTSGADYEGKIVIPDSIKVGSKTYNVPDVLNYAFRNSKVTEVEFPAACEGIYNYVFQDAKLLKSVKAPNVVKIFNNTFDGCEALETIELSPKALIVNPYAFRGCTSLKTFPHTLTEVYNNAFENSGLQSVNIGKTNFTAKYADKFLNCRSLKTVNFVGNVTELSPGMFAGCAIEHIEFPASLTSIGDSALARNPLRKIDLINARTIGARAFMGCPLDTIFATGPTVPSIQENTFSDSIYRNTIVMVPLGMADSYRDNALWKKFAHISESVDILPSEGSIVNRQGLYFVVKAGNEVWFCLPPENASPYSGAIVVPDSIDLGNGHWHRVTGADKLNSSTSFKSDTLILPASIRHITSISRLDSLKYLEIKSVDTWQSSTSLDNLSALTTLVLGDSVHNLGKIICPVLKSFHVPDSLRTLGDIQAPLLTRITGHAPLLTKLMSFYRCSSLTSVDSVDFLPRMINSAEDIPSSIFQTTSIDSISCPAAKQIRSNAFADMSCLRAVSLPEVLTLGYNALSRDTSLVIVYAPKLTSIGSYCFDGATNLKKLSFRALTTASSLGNMSGLESLDLPSLKAIPASMVTGATKLRSFVIGPDVSKIGSKAFQGMDSLELWHCPTQLLTTSKSTTFFQTKSGVYPVIWVAPGLKETFMSNAAYAQCDIREAGIKTVAFGADTLSNVTLSKATIVTSGTVTFVDSISNRVPELFRSSIGTPTLMNLRPQIEFRLKGDATVRKVSAKLDGMHVSASLDGLEAGTTYEYRWICSRDSAVNTPWRELTTKEWSADIDYTEGTLWLNEDWYGQDNGTVNYIDSAGLVYPRAYRHVNKDHQFGVTSQYGTLFGGRMYVVSKQAGDNGGILTVADARTLRRTASTSEFGGADGRAFCGATPEKGYVSTNNGIYAVALDSLRVLGCVPGTATGTGLYSGQAGDMVCLGNRLFAAVQDKGVLVIDTETDRIADSIPMPDVTSVFVTAGGKLYASLDSQTKPLASIDPSTMTATPISISLNGKMRFDWSSWRHSTIVPEPKKEKIWFITSYIDDYNGADLMYLSSYDFESKRLWCQNEPEYDSEYILNNYYGSPLAFNHQTGELMGAFCKGQSWYDETAGSWDYKKWWIASYDVTSGMAVEKSRLELPEYYWFPAMALNHDHADPTLDSIADTPLRLDSADRSLALKLDGKDADAQPWQMSYKVTSSDPGLLNVSTEGDMLTLTAMPGAQRKQTADITVQLVSNGKKAERTFTVTLEQRPDSVATPLVDCHDVFPESTHVTMTCSDPYAAIYYTTDGTDPTTESDRYTETFRINKSCTLKVAAFDDGVWSPVVTRTLTVDPLGVEGIYLAGDILTVPDDAEVYTPAGIRVAAGRMEHGIYIIVYRGQSIKLEVK